MLYREDVDVCDTLNYQGTILSFIELLLQVAKGTIWCKTEEYEQLQVGKD